MKVFLFGLLLMGFCGSAYGQTRPQPYPEVVHLRGDRYRFSWESLPGRVYFMQTSSQATEADGFDWRFAQEIRVGNGDDLHMGFFADDSKAQFFRLVYTDFSGSVSEANLEDFDNDGYTNLEETYDNTDPFDRDSFADDGRARPPVGGGNVGGNGGAPPASGGGEGEGAANEEDGEGEDPDWQYQLRYLSSGVVRKVFTVSPDQPAPSVEVYPLGSTYRLSLEFQDLIGENEIELLHVQPGEFVGGEETYVVADRFELSQYNESWTYDTRDFTVNLGTGAGEGHLALFEKGPEVLRVNSDFDEGRIDEEKGYAIPDCDDILDVDPKTGAGNILMGLNAVRDHLDDGDITAHKLTTEDLHEGWFGISPLALPRAFWKDANITISKLERIDSDTNRPESGQVRFYAKWGDGNGEYVGIEPYDLDSLHAVNLAAVGINNPGQAHPSVYGPNSPIPSSATFWMEGVRPGKITLEWRYRKGAEDIRFEQTFLVATEQSKEEWLDEVYYQIRIQTKVKNGKQVEISKYDPRNGFRNLSANDPPENDNSRRVREIYYYYQQLYLQNRFPQESFTWAGMAKTAAAPIYGAMSDLSTYLQLQILAQGEIGGRGTTLLINGLLCNGQLEIFFDKAWAHRAFQGSGIWSLNHVAENNSDAIDLPIWQQLAQGIYKEDSFLIEAASRSLLLREQRDIIQESYRLFATEQIIFQPRVGIRRVDAAFEWLFGFETVPEVAPGYAVTGRWLSANSKKNPMPGGKGFHQVVDGGRIDNFRDRWAWAGDGQDGMFAIWAGRNLGSPRFDSARRAHEVSKTMYEAALRYAFDGGGLPSEE